MQISKKRLNQMFCVGMTLILVMIIVTASACGANAQYKQLNRQLENKVKEKQSHVELLTEDIKQLNNELSNARKEIKELKQWEPQ